MKTIYMDITCLLNARVLTGIQRVVIEIASRLAQRQGEAYKLVLLRHNRDYSFTICDTDAFSYNCLASQELRRNAISTVDITVDELDRGAFWLDIDGVWCDGLMRRTVLYSRLSRRNIQIGVYVHDVIAMTHPHYVASDSLLRFPAFLGAVFDYADVIFTNTEFTKSEIQKLAAAAGCWRDIEYVIATPGCDFVKRPLDMEAVDPVAVEIAENGKFLLMVSTIEARKNHKVLLDALDGGLADMGYQLVFVGRTGWKVDELMERIREHPENGTKLFHLQGINDDTLRYLYENARFVLFPSYIEGFGLATVEAMQFGVPVILSDVPVMREVGGPFCDYFPPDEPQALVDIVARYDRDEAAYEAKRADLQTYEAPTWGACVDAILARVLTFRQAPDVPHHIDQIVYLSARQEALLNTLAYVEEYMPFIREAVVLCPDQMAKELPERYQGRLVMRCVSDSELLNGHELPEDHADRNFFLRCLAMRRPELHDEFIMSDDDYRPMKEIGEDVFLFEGRYQGYYFYDLDMWPEMVSEASSYDKGMFRTNEFLKRNGYPNLQYASHMPQIINKHWFLDILARHPEIATLGLCEWAVYFNCAVKMHPESFDVRPYVTMCWPGHASDWSQLMVPKEYLFENFYEELYEEEGIFAGMSVTFGPQTAAENYRKKIIWKNINREVYITNQRWKNFQNQYSSRTKQMPSFVLAYDGGEKTMSVLCTPQLLLMRCRGTYRFPCEILQQKDGKWMRSDVDVRIGCSFFEDESEGSIFWGDNLLGRGKAVPAINAPVVPMEVDVHFYYSLAGGAPVHLFSVPAQAAN